METYVRYRIVGEGEKSKDNIRSSVIMYFVHSFGFLQLVIASLDGIEMCSIMWHASNPHRDTDINSTAKCQGQEAKRDRGYR